MPVAKIIQHTRCWYIVSHMEKVEMSEPRYFIIEAHANEHPEDFPNFPLVHILDHAINLN